MFKGGMLLVWGGNLYTYPDFLPEGLGISWGIVQVPPVYVAAVIIGACFCSCSVSFFKFSSRASTCALWRTTRRRRFPWGARAACLCTFPGP